MKLKRVLIVGGGPSGSSCGITCSRGGLETIVFEKGNPYRDKACGDTIPANQKTLANLGLIEGVKKRSFLVDSALIHGFSGERVEIRTPMMTLQRSVFDQFLRDELESRGGKVDYGVNIKGIKISDEGVEIADSSGLNYEGDFAVLATGANVSLARSLGFEYSDNPVFALRTYIENVNKLNSNYFWLFRSKANLLGYAWAFPSPGNILNVGVGTRGKDAKLKSKLENFLQDKKMILGNSETLTEPKGAPIRIGMRNALNYGSRVILVGENINCAYDLTAEGIGPALESGYLAGRALLSFKEGGDSLKDYQDKLMRKREEFYKGYSQIANLVGSRYGNKLFLRILNNSEKMRVTFGDVIQEEKPSKNIFPMQSLLNFL